MSLNFVNGCNFKFSLQYKTLHAFKHTIFMSLSGKFTEKKFKGNLTYCKNDKFRISNPFTFNLKHTDFKKTATKIADTYLLVSLHSFSMYKLWVKIKWKWCLDDHVKFNLPLRLRIDSNHVRLAKMKMI